MKLEEGVKSKLIVTFEVTREWVKERQQTNSSLHSKAP